MDPGQDSIPLILALVTAVLRCVMGSEGKRPRMIRSGLCCTMIRPAAHFSEWRWGTRGRSAQSLLLFREALWRESGAATLTPRCEEPCKEAVIKTGLSSRRCQLARRSVYPLAGSFAFPAPGLLTRVVPRPLRSMFFPTTLDHLGCS